MIRKCMRLLEYENEVSIQLKIYPWRQIRKTFLRRFFEVIRLPLFRAANVWALSLKKEGEKKPFAEILKYEICTTLSKI